MTVCVVTGGIGSGKSTVCSMMNRLYGCPVYVADDRAKELYLSHPSLLEDIEKRLVMNLRDSEGGFLPSLLAQRIFAEPEALKTVESLLFPVLMEDFNSWKSGFRDKDFVVFESATVLEKDFFDGFGDCVLLVDAPRNVRTERTAMRDRVSVDAVDSRMKNQSLMNRLSDGETDDRIDHVLVNDSSLPALELKVREFVEKFLLKNN